MTPIKATPIVAALIVGIVLYASSVYVVDEANHVVITSFGKVIKARSEPGRYFLIPIVQQTHFIKKGPFLTESSNTVSTIDKRTISSSIRLTWAIHDLSKFYKASHDTDSASSYIQQIIQGVESKIVSEYESSNLTIEMNREDKSNISYNSKIMSRIQTAIGAELQMMGVGHITFENTVTD